MLNDVPFILYTSNKFREQLNLPHFTTSNERLGSAFGRIFWMAWHTNTKTRCATTRSKAPVKSWRGGQSAVFTRRNLEISWLYRDRNEIRMRSRSSNAITSKLFNLNGIRVAGTVPEGYHSKEKR